MSIVRKPCAGCHGRSINVKVVGREAGAVGDLVAEVKGYAAAAARLGLTPQEMADDILDAKGEQVAQAYARVVCQCDAAQIIQVYLHLDAAGVAADARSEAA